MKELSIDELEQNYQLQKRMQPAVQTAQATVQPQKKKKGGIGGFLTSLIGEAGGTGGALAGGATGAAIGSVVPGIGTAIGGLIGAGLGGFLGGTGGQIAENVVRDDEVNISKALKAGAVEGIMGAGPLKLLKGAAGATKAIKGAESIADLSKGAESAIRTPLLSKLPGAKAVGTKMTVTSSGLKPGKEIGALENVDQTANALSELGIKGTPKQQAKQIQTKISELGKAVDDTLAASPVPLQGSMVTKALAEAMADPANARYIDINLESAPVKKLIDQYSVKLNSITDAKSLNDFVKTINKVATQAEEKLRNPLAKGLTSKEEALLALKRASDDILSEVEAIKPYKQQMATLYGANADIIGASQKGIGVPMISGVSTKVPVQATKGLTSRIGANLQGSPQEVITNKGIIGRTLGTSALGAVTGAETGTEEQPIDMNTPSGPMVPEGATAPTEAPVDNSPFSPANVPANVQAILAQGGTMKDVKEYLSVVETINALGGTGAEKPLSAEAAKTIANANSGLQSLNDIRSLIQQDPSVVAKSSIPGQATPVGGYISSALGTGEYISAVTNAKDIISRLRSGAALTVSEEQRYKNLIPKAGDDAQTIDYKLGQLYDLFSSVSNRTGSAGTDLQASVAQ